MYVRLVQIIGQVGRNSGYFALAVHAKQRTVHLEAEARKHPYLLQSRKLLHGVTGTPKSLL
jgi:hypothetical protein